MYRYIYLQTQLYVQCTYATKTMVDKIESEHEARTSRAVMCSFFRFARAVATPMAMMIIASEKMHRTSDVRAETWSGYLHACVRVFVYVCVWAQQTGEMRNRQDNETKRNETKQNRKHNTTKRHSRRFVRLSKQASEASNAQPTTHNTKERSGVK